MYISQQPIRRPAWPIQFIDLFLIQLSNWRWSWRAMLVTGIFTPIVGIIALGNFVDRGRVSVAYVLVGSMVLSLMFENQNKVAQNFSYMKAMGTLDYFGTLPVRRYSVILATVSAFFVLSVPALAATLIFGSAFLSIELSLNAAALVVVPLCVLPLAGFGALIGVFARTQEETSSISLFVTIVLLFLGPVYVPPEQLPDWVVALSYLSPATYAASALRQCVIGPIDSRLWLDISALSAFSFAAIAIAGRKMRWRTS
ncbi:ABC transporter permease [Nocardia sp. NPDC005978]|uniref:ABC transporter permease n=1 Tax=Nocardia sp. NPDC005978 TaxID=3156725 RepID=UPI0033A58621